MDKTVGLKDENNCPNTTGALSTPTSRDLLESKLKVVRARGEEWAEKRNKGVLENSSNNKEGHLTMHNSQLTFQRRYPSSIQPRLTQSERRALRQAQRDIFAKDMNSRTNQLLQRSEKQLLEQKINQTAEDKRILKENRKLNRKLDDLKSAVDCQVVKLDKLQSTVDRLCNILQEQM